MPVEPKFGRHCRLHRSSVWVERNSSGWRVFKVYPNERAARQLAEQRCMDQRDAQLAAPARKPLENLLSA